jgi:hypothetical protein
VTPAARTPVRAWDRWIDRFAGSDPGLNRFRMAVQSVLAIGVILEAERLFVHFAHALQIQIQTHGPRLPAAQAAELAAANHAYLVIALLILGAAVAIAVIVLVLPLRTRRVLRIAVRDQVQAIGQLAGHALRLATAARHYSRNLVAGTAAAGPPDAATRLGIELAAATLRQSLDTVARAITSPRDAVYTRSSALFDQAERRIEEHSGTAGPAQPAIRDLNTRDGRGSRIGG